MRTLILLALVGSPAAGAQPPVSNAVLIKAGRILDVRAGTYRTNQAIWIEGGRIRQVGAFDEVRAAAPKDVALIDLGQKAVLPGLIDVHTHLLDAMDPGDSPADSLILTLTKESPTRRALLGAAMAREILEAASRPFATSATGCRRRRRTSAMRSVAAGCQVRASLRRHEIAPHGGQVLPCRAAWRAKPGRPRVPDRGATPLRDAARCSRTCASRRRVISGRDDVGRVIDEETMKAIVEEAHRADRRVAVHATTKPGVHWLSRPVSIRSSTATSD
jgi:imidazolonepropionase-like amidohydrolase